MDVLSLASTLKRGRELRGWSAAELARQVVQYGGSLGDNFTLSQQAVSHFEGGKAKTVPHWVKYAEKLLEDAISEAYLKERLGPSALYAITLMAGASPAQMDRAVACLKQPAESQARPAAEELDLVPIAEIDQDYGMGLTFTDNPIEVRVHHFPRAWVESITYSPPSELTIARGKGDSMDPTIRDRDMVIIDRSRRTIDEADAIWALTVGDIGMIKRLRRRGATVVIQSDNDRVSDEEVHADEVNIVGRIVFIGRRT